MEIMKEPTEFFHNVPSGYLAGFCQELTVSD